MKTTKKHKSLKRTLKKIRDRLKPNKLIVKKYLINDGKKHPFALVIPGGGYNIICAYSEGDDYAERFNKLGVNAFVIYYRVKHKACFPNPIDDVATALKDILANKDQYMLENEYVIVGSSAGGHLAGMFSRKDIGYAKYNLPKPSETILVYPVVTFMDATHEMTRDFITGKNPELNKFLSLEENITEDYPKTYFFCGKNDSIVPCIGSIKLKQALDEHHVENIFHLYDDLEHGAGIGDGTQAEGWLEQAYQFWKN